MPRVTALCSTGARVAVDLDGHPWRDLPAAAVVAAGLAVGCELDRARARTIRRELQRERALAAAGAALERRELGEQRLDAALARKAVPPALRRETLARLRQAGLVDDGRLAHGRARSLSERGWGDAAIRERLEQQGLAAADVHAAIEALAPEPERAAALVAREPTAAPRRLAALLARRGFCEDTVEAALGRSAAD